jgi:hypothetical protein
VGTHWTSCAMKATPAATLTTTWDDSRQEFAGAQLEDELVFYEGGDVMGGMQYH